MNKPLTIGIYVIRFPTASETFIVTKVLGLLEAGFDVRIFTQEPSQQWIRFAILQDRPDIRRRVFTAPPSRVVLKVLARGTYELVKTAVRHPVAFGRFVLHNWRHRHELPFGFLKGVYTRLHFVSHRLDVLHVEFDTQALEVADLKEYLHCKLLFSARGAFQATSVLDKFPNALVHLHKYVDGYHFISQYLRENMRRLGLPSSVRTWLIEPAIDLRLFKPVEPRSLRSAGAPLRVISVGRLTWQKGYEFAVDAVARVHAAGVPVEYRILGEGEYDDPAMYAAWQWGLTQQGVVTFVGAVRREEIPHYLADSDVMLHASLSEGLCNAVIEAQAMGVPVVASDAGGLPENIQDGVTGFVVPRRNPEALAEKLMVLAHDPELCLRMGQAGRARAAARFNLTDQVQNFISLYHELCGDTRPDELPNMVEKGKAVERAN